MKKSSSLIVRIWRQPKARAATVQFLALAATIGFFYVIASNTAASLQRQGIASGFDFLEKPTGFGIIQTLIPYDESSSYGRAFLAALLNTLLISFVGIVLGTVVGFIIGIARLSRNLLVSLLAVTYVEAIRNVPLLLQLFIWYFAVLRSLPGVHDSVTLGDVLYLNVRGLYGPAPLAVPGTGLWVGLVTAVALGGVGFVLWARKRQQATGRYVPAAWIALGGVVVFAGVSYAGMGRPLAWEWPQLGRFDFQGGFNLIPEFVAVLLALTSYTAAFIAEIVRAGILSVSKGQTEAAHALGLNRMQTLRFVVVPQAMRVIVPPMTSQYLNLTKNSSLSAAIAYPDLVLVFAGTVLLQTGQAVEVMAMTMGVFLLISLCISAAMNAYNKSIMLKERA